VVVHPLPLLLELVTGGKRAAAAASTCTRAAVALLAGLLLLRVIQDALAVHLGIECGCRTNLHTCMKSKVPGDF
jgi:hypothetical protein